MPVDMIKNENVSRAEGGGPGCPPLVFGGGTLTVMVACRALACVFLLTLVLTPVLGLAGDDFPGPGRAAPHESGVRHQPPRPWRTTPAVVEPHVVILRIMPLTGVVASERPRALPLLVRTRFIPPRG